MFVIDFSHKPKKITKNVLSKQFGVSVTLLIQWVAETFLFLENLILLVPTCSGVVLFVPVAVKRRRRLHFFQFYKLLIKLTFDSNSKWLQNQYFMSKKLQYTRIASYLTLVVSIMSHEIIIYLYRTVKKKGGGRRMRKSIPKAALQCPAFSNHG